MADMPMRYAVALLFWRHDENGKYRTSMKLWQGDAANVDEALGMALLDHKNMFDNWALSSFQAQLVFHAEMNTPKENDDDGN